MAGLTKDRKSIRLLIGTVLIGFAMVAFGHDDILDARFFYTGEFAQLYFSLLTEVQTKAYIRGGILDLVFIHFYSSLVWHEFSKFQMNPNYRKLVLFPSLIDLFETVSILLILVTGSIPRELDWLGLLTATKWSTAAAVFLWWIYLLVFRRRQAHRGL